VPVVGLLLIHTSERNALTVLVDPDREGRIASRHAGVVGLLVFEGTDINALFPE
jgi:hypothetical protein